MAGGGITYWIAGAAIVLSLLSFVIGWFRTGSHHGDLTDEQIIERGDQRQADLIHGDVR